MPIVELIRQAWGWLGIEPVEVVGENDFGNLLIKDREGRYWRLCPEDCYCQVVATNRQELDALSINQAFLHDWYMRSLVESAHERLGPLPEGTKYCLRIPGVLGGKYSGDNLAIAPLNELVLFAGDIAKQIHELPDGAAVKLRIAD